MQTCPSSLQSPSVVTGGGGGGGGIHICAYERLNGIFMCVYCITRYVCTHMISNQNRQALYGSWSKRRHARTATHISPKRRRIDYKNGDKPNRRQ